MAPATTDLPIDARPGRRADLRAMDVWLPAPSVGCWSGPVPLARLRRGAVVMPDDNIAQTSSMPTSRAHVDGNSQQHRTLGGSSRHQVLTNWPTPALATAKAGTGAWVAQRLDRTPCRALRHALA